MNKNMLIRLLFEIEPNKKQEELILKTFGDNLWFYVKRVPAHLLSENILERILLRDERSLKGLFLKFIFSPQKIRNKAGYHDILGTIYNLETEIEKELEKSIENLIIGALKTSRQQKQFIALYGGAEAKDWREMFSGMILKNYLRKDPTDFQEMLANHFVGSKKPDECMQLFFEDMEFLVDNEMNLMLYIFGLLSEENQVKFLKIFSEHYCEAEDFFKDVNGVANACFQMVFGNINGSFYAEDSVAYEFLAIVNEVAEIKYVELDPEKFVIRSKNQLALGLA